MNIDITVGRGKVAGKLPEPNVLNEKIFIKTNRIGFIPPLGVQGPIVNPYPTTRAAAKECIVAGIEVYEVTKDKKVNKLTLQNVFGEKESAPVAEKPNAGVTSNPKTTTFSGVPVKNEKKDDTKEEPKAEEKAKDTTEENTVDASPAESKDETPSAEKPDEKKDSNKNNNKKNNKK